LDEDAVRATWAGASARVLPLRACGRREESGAFANATCPIEAEAAVVRKKRLKNNLAI